MCLEIFAVKIPSQIPPDIYTKLLSLLPDSISVRIKKFLVKKSAYQSLAGTLLLRSILSKRLSVTPATLDFAKNGHGKPYLIDHPDHHFNLAHSESFAVAAFDTRPVGIDVEFIREIDLQIAERFFCKEESDALFKKEKDRQLSFFYDIWTLKESFIKAEGKGLSIPLDSFCFTIDENGNINLQIHTNEKRDYQFRQYKIDVDYMCAVCSCQKKFPEEVTFLDWDNLCKEFLILSE